MIRLLKRFADWLDSRFPPTVRVTDESFRSMLLQDAERIQQMNTHRVILNEHRTKIDKLEASVHAIKDLLSKAAAPAVAPEKRRSDFIASGRMAE